ncbi:MAG: Preprotein translocase subunit SecG [Verrucomicrobiales bacterium]|jgi:preprotein translocase subunit SecG|nr:Preprotein translocase subunit SecG [Verrucomicrobiales bacterium]MDB6129243.1 Preprotein translocase subunit SecG [Verrucomicrobiales bacterium]
MLSFFIGILTVILILDSLFLILLVMVQLPKKEAGSGMAFGGSTAEAILGAGSGTVLTKITKYAAGIFFALALLLSLMNARRSSGNANRIQETLSKKAAQTAPSTSLPGLPAASASTNSTLTVPANGSTNKPVISAPAGTNSTK